MHDVYPRAFHLRWADESSNVCVKQPEHFA